MPKLKLNVDDLRVEGFSVADEDRGDMAVYGPTAICTEKRSCGGICP
jgi:hypothetical protein